MIDITVNSSLTNKEAIKNMKELGELKGIAIYCDAGYFEYTEDSAFTKDAIVVATDNDFCSDEGYHFVIDAESIVRCVPEDKQTKHLKDGKNTYINRALYDNKANEHSISVAMVIPKGQKYEDIERKTIKFVADYLIKKKLEPNSVMRGFDLNKFGSPLHLLEKERWRKFIALLEATYKAMKDEKKEYTDEELEKAEVTYKDKEVREFYLKNGENEKEYSRNFEPDHRDIEDIKSFQSTEAGEIKEFTTENNTTFTYSIVENIPGSSEHCTKAFDTLSGVATPNGLDVEPIYPDLIVPPGGTVTLIDTITASKQTQSNNVPLSLEDFENREQAFNIKNYKDASKKVEGKPVNNNDPFPADDKIKELESHTPKIKIDEVGFKLHDCNHPGSIIGPEVAKNFAMVQDEIITMAKRTERRIVKLENIMSTVMRNLFRTASRMQINCVYYGGQDIYGKKVLNFIF